MWEMFSTSSSQQWKAAIEKELKGKDYESTLVHDIGGIRIEPIYHSDQAIPTADLSGTFHQIDNSWEARQDFLVNGQTKAEDLLSFILTSVKHGIQHLAFHLRSDKPAEFWASIFAAITVNGTTRLSSLTIYIPDAQWMASLSSALQNSEISPSNIRLVIDPMPFALASSRWSAIQNKECLATLEHWASLGYQSYGIDGRLWYELGIHAGLELALIFAQVSEYLGSTSLQKMPDTLSISIAVGRNFFSDIAKLRALRAGFKHLQQQNGWDSVRLSIYAQTGVLNKSQTEAANNLMRNTTEAIAAIIGGCDTLAILPHDGLTNAPNPFSMRMAQNIHHLLRAESHLDKVIDPGQGAYFIEYLTHGIFQQSMEIFEQIKVKGGFYTGLITGWLQQEFILPSQQQTFQPFTDGKASIIGVNQYPFGDVEESTGLLEAYGLHLQQEWPVRGDEVPFDSLAFQRLAQLVL